MHDLLPFAVRGSCNEKKDRRTFWFHLCIDYSLYIYSHP